MILRKSDQLQYYFKVKMTQKCIILSEFNHTNRKNDMDSIRDDLKMTSTRKNFQSLVIILVLNLQWLHYYV